MAAVSDLAKPIVHFGNFLRWRFDSFGGLAGVARRSKSDGSGGLSVTKLVQLAKEPSPPPRLRNTSRIILARSVGFTSIHGHGDWGALDAAWQTTPLPLYKAKDGPIFPRGVLTHEQLSDLASAEDWNSITPFIVEALHRMDDDRIKHVGSAIPLIALDNLFFGARGAVAKEHHDSPLIKRKLAKSAEIGAPPFTPVELSHTQEHYADYIRDADVHTQTAMALVIGTDVLSKLLAYAQSSAPLGILSSPESRQRASQQKAPAGKRKPPRR